MQETSLSKPDAQPAVGGLELKRTLGVGHLIILGVGGIIGAGIFVITGTAAAFYAGPAVFLSFILAGMVCLFAGLCYGEFSAMIPESGSAYSYARHTLGEAMAWIIGWCLVLEYMVAAGAVAAGWSGYFNTFLGNFGITLPAALITAPFDTTAGGEVFLTGAIVNLPAMLVIGLISAVLICGIRQSVLVAGLIVVLKLAVICLVIVCGFLYADPTNWVPLVPENQGSFGAYGWSGVLRASGVVFFAFLGFDAVSTAAQEAKNPQKDMPVAILGTLLIATTLYVAMAVVMTGLAPYGSLAVPSPITVAISNAGPDLFWLKPLVDFAAVIGLASAMLVMLLGQSRIFLAMARDRLIPELFGRLHPRFRTPYLGTIVIGSVSAMIGGMLPLHVIGELVSIGTLFAFMIVCLSVMVLRRTRADLHRPFRVPLFPLVPLLGMLSCFALMLSLPSETWGRFLAWTAVGLVIYFGYGRTRAQRKSPAAIPALAKD